MRQNHPQCKALDWSPRIEGNVYLVVGGSVGVIMTLKVKFKSALRIMYFI